MNLESRKKKRIVISYEEDEEGKEFDKQNKINDLTEEINLLGDMNNHDDQDIFSDLDNALAKISLKTFEDLLIEKNKNLFKFNFEENVFDPTNWNFNLVPNENEQIQTVINNKVPETKFEENKFTEDFLKYWESIEEMRKSIRVPLDNIIEELYKTKKTSRSLFKYQTIIWLISSSRSYDIYSYNTFLNFKNYGFNCDVISKISQKELYDVLGLVSFKKHKSKMIVDASKMIKNVYHGDPPETREELINIPGLGPTLVEIYLTFVTDVSHNIFVGGDIHRVFNRLKLIKTENKKQTKAELENIVPKSLWPKIYYVIEGFGKEICTFVNPICEKCKLNKSCYFYLNNGNEEEKMKRKKKKIIKEEINTHTNASNPEEIEEFDIDVSPLKEDCNEKESFLNNKRKIISSNISNFACKVDPINKKEKEELKIKKEEHKIQIEENKVHVFDLKNPNLKRCEKIMKNISNVTKPAPVEEETEVQEKFKKMKTSNKDNLSKMITKVKENLTKLKNINKDELISDDFLNDIAYDFNKDENFNFDYLLPKVNKRKAPFNKL